MQISSRALGLSRERLVVALDEPAVRVGHSLARTDRQAITDFFLAQVTGARGLERLQRDPEVVAKALPGGEILLGVLGSGGRPALPTLCPLFKVLLRAGTLASQLLELLGRLRQLSHQTLLEPGQLTTLTLTLTLMRAALSGRWRPV